MVSTSLEILELEPIGFNFKRFGSTFKVLYLQPNFKSAYFVRVPFSSSIAVDDIILH